MHSSTRNLTSESKQQLRSYTPFYDLYSCITIAMTYKSKCTFVLEIPIGISSSEHTSTAQSLSAHLLSSGQNGQALFKLIYMQKCQGSII